MNRLERAHLWMNDAGPIGADLASPVMATDSGGRDVEPTLRVDADALRRLAAQLSDDADQLEQLDPMRAFDDAARALRRSETGAAAATAADPVRRCYRRMADQVRAMSSSALANADSYSATDEAFRRQFAQYRLGLPCDPR